jgi:hypothetical protein
MLDSTFPSLIVDQDISQENILMNHRGKIPHSACLGVDESPDFRSTFAVQYLITDFDFSSYSYIGPNSGLRIDPLSTGRPHKAPESVRSRFDPYAVDVYQVTRFLYAWFHVRVALRALCVDY